MLCGKAKAVDRREKRAAAGANLVEIILAPVIGVKRRVEY
jgi:hypothetical protein